MSQATVKGRQRHRTLTVAEVVHETPDARSLVFDVAADDAAWFTHRPGQFVTVKVPHPDGDVARCYSISSAPGAERFAITVKRAGPTSAWLCDQVAAGWTLDVLPPAGRFTPTSMDDDLLLVAAGSGITPIMSIVRAVMASGSAHLTLLYANRDAESVIFGRQLELLSVRHTGRLRVIHWWESERGLPSADALGALLQPYVDRETYLCGPAPFMSEVSAALTDLGKPARSVHRERFVSLEDDPFAESVEVDRGETAPTSDTLPPDTLPSQALPSQTPSSGNPARVVQEGTALEVVLDGAARSLIWPPDVLLLDLLEREGLPAPSSCRSGRCGACATRVTEGRVQMLANEVLDAQDLAEGYVLACQARPDSERLRITYD